jgi:hypothetical protein
MNTAAEEDLAFDRMQAARDLAGEMGYDDDSEFDDLEDQERAYHSRMSGGYEG